MIRLGRQRGIPRARFFSDWAEHIGSGIGVALFMIAVLAACGVFPRGLADVHIGIVSGESNH